MSFEFDVEIGTGVTRYLLMRLSGKDPDDKLRPWERIAEFYSYNDIDIVMAELVPSDDA